MYNSYITKIKNLHKHTNADRLLVGECFGNSVIVSLDYQDNQLGVYFPVGGQLSLEFAEKNNLLRKKDDSGNSIGGYMDPDKRNITAIKLRGEKSDGLFLPLSCLDSFGDIKQLKEGDLITAFNGHEIACKYIPAQKSSSGGSSTNSSKKKSRKPLAPLFTEHVDTEQLAYNLSSFKVGDEVEITLKMHGTSQRTGYLPVLKGYKRSFLDKIFRRDGKPIYDYDYISGTRRTVLENFEGGFYGNNAFRQIHHDKFVGKLNKGETVYYEVVGFTNTGTPIMGTGNTEKLGKEYVKQYGKEMVFSYGCDPNTEGLPASDLYVYRMTITNEDGFTVEYTPDFMRYRCEQIGVKTVMVWEKFTIPSIDNPGEYVKQEAEQYYEGTDPVGKTHIKEGVVCRILNRPTFKVFKHKGFSFKLIEGIIKEKVDESQDKVSDDILSEM